MEQLQTCLLSLYNFNQVSGNTFLEYLSINWPLKYNDIPVLITTKGTVIYEASRNNNSIILVF